MSSSYIFHGSHGDILITQAGPDATEAQMQWADEFLAWWLDAVERDLAQAAEKAG